MLDKNKCQCSKIY
ncbi:hypothetical protein BUZ22_08210 [Staphylococcus haemolyticus]|nr:hypothetical protein BUY18_10585 [Staphylococcus cohnii]RIO67476.1 hypothetical protein BUZ22_08210 [Staphylococcus haemolyticus]